jgi:hypothetical protein
MMDPREKRLQLARKRRRNTARHNLFYQSYVRHLPEVPLDAPYERGRVYHTCIAHDDWCRFYSSNNIADCDCNMVTRHVEPRRS